MIKLIVVILSIALAQILAAPSPATIAPSVTGALLKHGTVNIILTLEEKTAPALQQIQHQSFANRGARLNAVASTLKSLAARSQKSILEFLATQNVQVKSLWISNKIAVKAADAKLVQTLASMKEVQHIREDLVIQAPLPVPEKFITAPAALQWGVEMIEAPKAWELGFRGQDVVVAILDSGVRHTHNTLFNSYRQDRGWFDASSGFSQTPVDPMGHGTHVMGSIVGADGVGVAPDAQWIACRTAMTFSGISEYQECGQFFLCPTHADGSDPDCTTAPHVVSHSWGFYPSVDEDFLDESILAWNVAGIIVVWANGNEGTSCSSARYPANTDFDMITVGATDSSDRLASFSSRGPGTWTNALKPNIAAPGVDVISASAWDDESLVSMSGITLTLILKLQFIVMLRNI